MKQFREGGARKGREGKVKGKGQGKGELGDGKGLRGLQLFLKL